VIVTLQQRLVPLSVVLVGLAALLVLALPAPAQAQAYRSLLGQGWTYVEAGNYRKAEEAFKAAFATPEGKNAAEVYYAIAALWWERRNAMASYMWLSDADKAARSSFNWDGGPDGEWDQRIEQRRTYIQRNFGAVRLRAPTRGAPLPPLVDPIPTDPLLKEFTDHLPTVIEEGVAEKVAVQWVLLPAGDYWVGDDLQQLDAGQLDASKAPAWELPKDAGKVRKSYEERVAALSRGESPAAAMRDELLARTAEIAAAEKAEQDRLEAERAAADAERAAAQADAARAAAAEKAAADKAAAEKAAADRAEAERLAARDKAAAEKAAADKAEAERLAARDKAAAEKAAADKAAADRAEAERLAARDKAAAEKAAADKAAADKAAADKAAADKAAAERLAAERLAARDKAAAEKAAADRAEAERIAAAQTDAERQAEADRAARAEADRKAQADRDAADRARREQERKDAEWEQAQARMRAEQEREREAESLRKEQLREQRMSTSTAGDAVFETRRLALSTGGGGSTVTRMSADASTVGLDWTAQVRVDYVAPIKGATVALPIGLSWANLPVNGCSHKQTRANSLALHLGPRFAAPIKGRLWFAAQIGAHVGGGASFPTGSVINQCASESLKPDSDGVVYGARLRANDDARGRLSLGDLGWTGWALLVGPDADLGILGAPGAGATYLGVSLFLRYDQVLPVIRGTAYQFQPEGQSSPDLSSVTLETLSGQASMARFQFGLRGRILF
jgi:hypothetical protein